MPRVSYYWAEAGEAETKGLGLIPFHRRWGAAPKASDVCRGQSALGQHTESQLQQLQVAQDNWK